MHSLTLKLRDINPARQMRQAWDIVITGQPWPPPRFGLVHKSHADLTA